MTTSKGLATSLDLLISSSILILVLLSTYEVYNTSVLRIQEYTDDIKTTTRALDISQALVKTPGYPVDWNELSTIDETTVTSFGIAFQDNRIDEEKLQALSTVDYDVLKQVMGLGKDDFSIQVKDVAEGSLAYDFGYSQPGYPVKVSRLALINETVVEVVVNVYGRENRL